MSKHPRPQLKDQAAQDHAEGQSELLNHLKQTPTSDLHTVDPELLARLTADQRRELFTKDIIVKVPQNIIKRRTEKVQRSRPRLMRRAWNILPNLFKSQIIGACTSLVVTAAGMGLMTNWPAINAQLQHLTRTEASDLLNNWRILFDQETSQ